MPPRDAIGSKSEVMFVQVCANMPNTRSTSNINALLALFKNLAINQGPAIPFNAEAVFCEYSEEPETNAAEEFPPIPSYQSVKSIASKTTPSTRKAVTFETSKKRLTQWLKYTKTYRCHATGTPFHPNCPSRVQFAHIHLPRLVKTKEWANIVVSSISYSVFRLLGITDCSIRIYPRYEIQDLVDP